MARLALLFLIAALSSASAQSAQIAVDLASGSVLAASEADAPREPASLVKLMTGYVAFEALSEGTISEQTMVAVSRAASRRPPVKLGLRAGTELSFGEVLGAALVGSKNDAAAVVAEAVGGNLEAFVARMNAAAARLGMTNTRFVNATGLPADGQQTTARDMAILARALLVDFPKRSTAFSRRSVVAMGRRVSTTNPLFGRVAGAEGMKTGFTCAAGYSIVSLVEREGRRVIAVSLGHRAKGARLKAIKGLIEASFKLEERGNILAPGPVTRAAPPNIGACSGATVALKTTDIQPEDFALYQAELEKARLRVADMPSPRVEPRPQPQVLGQWGIFLGAYADGQEAKARLRDVRGKYLRGLGLPRLPQRVRDKRRLALFLGLDQPTAAAVCRAVQGYCLVLSPEAVRNPRARWRR